MSGKISPDLLRKIKDSISILEVVGQHVVLRKSGSNYVGLCPFHSERSPSFSVSETKQLYHCYGCKRGGDLVTFVMEILGVSFPDALEELADQARITLPQDWSAPGADVQNSQGESSDKNQTEKNQRESTRRKKVALSYKLNRFAAAYFHQNLTSQPTAQEYFRKRGVGSEWIESFYLGAASESWEALAQHLTSTQAPLDLAVELGLIRPSTKGNPQSRGVDHFDLFRNRVVFPIVNLRGKIAGFGGRILNPNDAPKYLNSPDSLIFQKGKLAFGLFQAQKYIREQDEVILVEGYFDTLAMHVAGFRNVVATCGTALTAEHFTLFKRLASRITVLFDGDEAGRAATHKAMETGLDQGTVLYGAQLPDGLDPDEMVLGLKGAGGIEQMKAILKESRPLLDAGIEECIRVARKSPEDRVQSVKKIGGWLKRFKDPVGKEVRIQLIQKELGISRSVMIEAVGPNELVGKPVPIEKPKEKRDVKRTNTASKIPPVEKMILSGIIFGGEYSQVFSEVRGTLPGEPGWDDSSVLFTHSEVRSFIARLQAEPEFLERLRKNPDTLMDDGMGLDQQIRSVLTESSLWSQPPFSLEEFRGAILKCKAKVWARFSQRIKRALSEAELNKDMGLQVQLMKDYLDVQRKMKEFSSFYDQE